MKYNTVIIGSGVAGMTAAIYLKRANIDVCIIEKDAPGGQLLKTAKINNYPGFTEIEGPELAVNMYNQVTALKIPYVFSEVIDIEITKEEKIVKTTNSDIICQNIIIATGRSPRKLGIENEEKLVNRGISWCATCDGALYKDKNVAVIGAGNAAVEEALYLADICKKVSLISRRDGFRAEESIVDDLKIKDNVEIIPDAEVKKFNEKDGVLHSITILEHKNNEEREIEVEGCFEFIGQTSNVEYLKDLEILDDKNFIIVDENGMTSISGIYGIGDCIKKDLYQIVTAASEGAIAATNIIKNKVRNK